MKRLTALFLIAIMLLVTLGCNMSNTKKGTAIGATSGAVIGGVIGNKAGNTAVGAILGAAIGGAAGAYIGNYMDKQKEEMEKDLEGATIERIGEGIKITFDSGILFDVNQSALKAVSKENLGNLAEILNKYDDTHILLEGHTDDTGAEDYNLQLSEKRAASVSDYLKSLNVDPSRFTIMGYGEDQPVADNTSVEGRSQNRRVEVAIYANEELKKTAEQQAKG